MVTISYCVFYFSGLKEDKGTSSSTTASTLMMIGNHFRVLLFEFIVPLGLVFYFKCMLIQDEIDLNQACRRIIIIRYVFNN